MHHELRGVYARLRRVPALGPALSRLVWAAKGLMGRPVAIAAPPLLPVPPQVRPATTPVEAPLRIALEGLQALERRLAALEAAASPVVEAEPEGDRRRAGDTAPTTVSVIIATLDRARWLDRALTALAYQRHPDFEVIVVAGPSRDDTADVLARHARDIEVVACPLANLAVARNLGLARATGDLVAFLDDDAVAEPDWLEELASGFVDPQVAGVGGYIRDGSGVDFQCRTVVADRFGASRDVGEPGRARLDPPGPGVRRYLSLTGTNCAFRRQALLDIGGFDEAYAYFLDETDLCLRLAEAGWRLAVAPQAEVRHAYAESAQRDADRTPRRLFDCVRSTTYFALRHAGPVHGLTAAAQRLDAYAEGLARDTDWRCGRGLIAEADAERMAEEIRAGVADGARLAFSPPRRLGASPPAAMSPWSSQRRRPPVLRAQEARLRLALLCQDYPVGEATRPPGGIAVWTQALATALAKRGHEVSVFARAAAGPTRIEFQAHGGSGVSVHRVGPAAAGRRADLLAQAPDSVARPAEAVAAEVLRIDPRRRFDVAVGPLWDLEPAALLGRAPWPVAVSLHTACAQMAPHRPEWTAAYRRGHVDRVIAAERRLLAAAPALLANSEAIVADLARTFALADLAVRAEVIAHGLPDLAAGVAPAPRPSGVEFLFVGRLERRKGIDVLLQAAPEVLARAPEARVTLVGEAVEADGVGADGVEAFLARCAGAPWLDRFQWLGPLPQCDLLARYAACDAVLVPSRYESFGLTAVEAMIFAKPVIAGACGGLQEIVVDGVTGTTVAPGDAAALARAMLALAASPERRAAMGAAGRRRYEELYTDARMAERFEAWAARLARRSDRMPLAAE